MPSPSPVTAQSVAVTDPALKQEQEQASAPPVSGPKVLASHRMPLPATFKFTYYGMAFDAGIRRGPDGGAQLVVRGNLGHIPYSAESTTARKYLHTVVDAGRYLPNAAIDVDRRQAIIVRGEMNFPKVPSPATVAAGTAAITIAIKPVCELVAKCRKAGGV